MRLSILSFCLTFCLSLPLLPIAATPPEEFLGHEVGADYKLARWQQIIDYFELMDQESDRVVVRDLGQTTEDNPYIMAVISSPETINQLEHYKAIQRKLSHPNEMEEGERDNLLREAKSVLVIACALHSNEIASSQMSMELLHDLATKDDPQTMEILRNDIILLVPSANPDGINKIIDWYERSLDTPWEGQGMPWLYHKYVGHDNNRDWYMLSQKETRILTEVLYKEWYPTIIYDIHQMGNSGCRFFVPPFFDPINPNVDPLIHESLKIIGGHMATDLSRHGKTGVLSNAIYDNWWHGGNRTTPYRHNIIGILTEAASPRIASPVFQRKSELRGHSRGLSEYRPQVNFAEPWEGGWWRLRDVVEYEKIACNSLFTLAARYRDMFNENYLNLNEKAIRLGKEEPPYAYLIPPKQRDLPTAIRLINILHMGGIEVSLAQETFTADGKTYPEGTYIVYCAQPYRNHIRDLFEPQDYPERYTYPGGPPEAPYDVAGWTLSYQMGVDVVPVKHSFDAEDVQLKDIEFPLGQLIGNTSSQYISHNQTTNDFILLNRALRENIRVSTLLEPATIGNDHEFQKGALLYFPKPEQQEKFESWVKDLSLRLHYVPNNRISSLNFTAPLSEPRLGIYQPWTANMDEGWTRFILEQFEFDFQVLHNAQIRAGNLNEMIDVLIIPDMGSNQILNGRAPSTTAPEYVGGIGEEGVMHLQKFVAEGGKLLCLDTSSMFAIRYFDLPVKNTLSGLARKDFYCPGSIIRLNLDNQKPLAYGMDHHAAAYFAHSYAFETNNPNKKQRNTYPQIGSPKVIADYNKTITLLSGFLHGEKHLQNKAAIVSVAYGEGSITLYGFRVQRRAQPHGTFRLLFNGVFH